MAGKSLTYFQFKKIANNLGGEIDNPARVAEESGITDWDYDLLHEYLLKWRAEQEAIKKLSPKMPQNNATRVSLENTTLENTSLMGLFRATLESSKDGIVIVDNDGKLVDWNEKFVEVADIPQEGLEKGLEQVGLDYVFNNVKDPEKLIFELAEIEENNSYKGDYGIVEYKNGRIMERYTQPLLVNGEAVGRVWSFKDITKEKELQNQLTFNAYHDLLTGLANRTGLLQKMEEKIANKDKFAVCYIDLDNFKLINDSLGHHVGDIMIKNVGTILAEIFNEASVVSRIGGDEYVVVLDNIENQEEALDAVTVIKKLTSKPVNVGDYEFNITLTMGISFYPHDAATPLDLLKNADSAMYKKKAKGKNGIGFYDSDMKTKTMRKVQIANKIHKAIENNELSLNYQPILDLKTQKIASFEALIRWNNEELGGFVPPDEFIAVTEEVGFIDSLTYWVFQKGLEQLKQWHIAGYAGLRITLNLSGILLYNPSIVKKIHNIILESGVAPEMITIELTENVFINYSESINKSLNNFKDIGLKIAIDDFGTGYSSYSYLQQLPIDVIKIDKMFTQALVSVADPDKIDNEKDFRSYTQSKAIVLSIIELGKHAHYDIVAEGVETINQMNFLKEHNCTYGQGYYFSRPIPVKDVDIMLYENSLSAKK